MVLRSSMVEQPSVVRHPNGAAFMTPSISSSNMNDTGTVDIADATGQSPVRALRWALAWAVLFRAVHGYWYLGGTLGRDDAPSPLPGAPASSAPGPPEPRSDPTVMATPPRPPPR